MKSVRRGIAWLLSLILMLGNVPLATAGDSLFYGDVDRNGSCGTSDVRDILLYAVGITAFDAEQITLADYNEDGVVNSSDARSLLFAVTSGQAEKPYVPPISEETLLSASAYDGEPFVIVNDNMPLFTAEEKQTDEIFELYAPLDTLGRCGTAYATICTELMPTEDRESISSVIPTGWHNQQYDHVPGGWVYNRSHMIGFQLAGEQANTQNLITGTRYMNTEGMLPFENMIADYVKETDNRVLYRVTPIFSGDNLLAEGVRMEAWSMEDNGEGICFHVFCYNVQPGVVFEYATGENHAADEIPVEPDDPVVIVTYVLNINTKKFHLPDCRYASSMSEENREDYGGTREDLITNGYSPCGTCKP